MTNHPNRRVAALYRVWLEADKAWVAEMEKTFPDAFPGVIRFRTQAHGQPDTDLRKAYDACRAAEKAFKDAGGANWLQGKEVAQ